MREFNLKNFVNVPTWFKSNIPTCIDLVLTSDKRKISLEVIETGLSDFHAMVVATLKSNFHKKGPSIVTYREYSKFDNFAFR